MTRLILWLALLLVTACQTQLLGQNSTNEKVTISSSHLNKCENSVINF